MLNADKPFDPQPILDTNKPSIIFGYQYMAPKLPSGAVLVWLKRQDAKLGKFCSDGELAWEGNTNRHGVYVFRHVWDGFIRDSERGIPRLHPTQKPEAVMRWCISRLQGKIPEGGTIIDPYCGSGTTGIAALSLGFNFIGVELSPE